MNAPLTGEGRPPAVAAGRLATPRRLRDLAVQAAVLAGLALAVFWVVSNAVENLRRANIVSGFGFFDWRAGFDISDSLIPFTSDDTIARALLVGVINTLLVAVIGIVLATVIGLLVAVARLSTNWLIARLGTLYVEVLRNIPLLLFLLFWYRAVLSVLPPPRLGYALPLGANLSNRGLIVPRPIFSPGFELVALAAAVALLAATTIALWARRRRIETGEVFPTLLVNGALLALLPALALLATGSAVSFELPQLQGFNFVGGLTLRPEFVALVVGLSAYTAAFIAEVIRAGILGVSRGQAEAALALGLSRAQALRHVVLPQALRIILPPLTGQFLNLTKNSTLAVAIGYPDFVAIVAGSAMQRTSQAVEVVALVMAFYLALSLLTAAAMNWLNRRLAIVER